MRRRLALFVVALVAAGPVVPADAAKACAKRSGAWSVVPDPAYPASAVAPGVSASLNTVSLAVDAADPQRMYATNDQTLLGTVDGGCTWKPLWTLPATPPGVDTPYHVQGTRIGSVVASPMPGDRTLYLVLGPRSAQGLPVPQTYVLRSNDGGATWTRADSGLPPMIGSDYWFRVAPSDPKVLYFATPYHGIWASTDRGASWQQRSITTPAICCTLDPGDANVLWHGTPVSRSTDGGRTFTQVFSWRGIVGVERLPGRPARVLAVGLDAPVPYQVWRSDDGGARFTADQPLPTYSDSVFAGRAPGTFLVVNHSWSVVRYDGSKASGKRWAVVAPPAGHTWTAVRVQVTGAGTRRTLTTLVAPNAGSARSIVRYVGAW